MKFFCMVDYIGWMGFYYDIMYKTTGFGPQVSGKAGY